MSENAKVKGPASYFPSIVATAGDKKHMEMVSWLKSEHGLGHGHANALVAHHLAASKA